MTLLWPEDLLFLIALVCLAMGAAAFIHWLWHGLGGSDDD